jgi:hypothetical protein
MGYKYSTVMPRCLCMYVKTLNGTSYYYHFGSLLTVGHTATCTRSYLIFPLECSYLSSSGSSRRHNVSREQLSPKTCCGLTSSKVEQNQPLQSSLWVLEGCLPTHPLPPSHGSSLDTRDVGGDRQDSVRLTDIRRHFNISF